MTPNILHAMRNGVVFPAEDVQLKPDICKRTFTLYVGNGFVDESMNTPEGLRDVEVCAKFLRGYCYRRFGGGQMEQVLDDLVCISYIHTPSDVLYIVRELRRRGISGGIRLEVEYVEGYPEQLKTY